LKDVLMTSTTASRRLGLSVLLALVSTLLGACAGVSPPDAVARQALAPAGVLRVGVYPGSPTSLVRDPKTGKSAGVALELGQTLGKQLAVPVQVVEFSRLALVLEGVKAGTVDFTFTNATDVRARDMDFTEPLIRLELGYLVPPQSTLSVGGMDRTGVRVGVAEGSSSQGALGLLYKNATVVPAASLAAAQQMLRRGEIDAFATNKGILFEMSDELPGYRVLDGRWGLENLAIAIPKGREAGLPYLRQFARDTQASGPLQAIVAAAGLRGVARSD
jgi:polar amino acid transport system substrate-binding protein